MHYIYDILRTTETTTPFKTFAKDKFEKYISYLNSIDITNRDDKLLGIFKSTPIPKQIIDLFNQYNSMADGFLEYMTLDNFYDLLDSKHPLHKVSLMPEKRVKLFIISIFNSAQKYYLDDAKKYAKSFTNPKEVMQIYTMYS
jgi:hypothetical protein